MLSSKFTVLRRTAPKLFLLRTICELPIVKPKPIVVTIIGGNTGEGQLTALLLKQSKLIHEIRLYSGLIDICGIGVDLSHIDTNPLIKAYTGQHLLKEALHGAQIVLVCGGSALTPCRNQNELFESNADYVRNITIHMGEFNPKGIFCISTPPVESIVPMVSEELKRASVYDPRKVLGLVSLNVIRANSLVGKYINKDPSTVSVPIIGGSYRHRIVPVFSQVKPCTPVAQPLAKLMYDKNVSAEDEVLDLKYIENSGSCFVSRAFACARFVTSVVKAVKGEKNVIESAFVRQTGHIQNFLPYMASIVKIGSGGVERCFMPRLNAEECEHLQTAYPLLKRSIDTGKSYITGDLPQECRLKPRLSGQCDIVLKKPITKIGDVVLDPEEITKEKEEKCIEIIT